MNISRPYKNQKNRAQAMMEFALALPLLLLLLYGVLETGRYLFIYASTITAARQAVRYGSATGVNPDNGVSYYNDCDGITAAANKVGFINTFDTVDISYDGGINSANGNPLPLDPADPACGSFDTLENGDRILVEVTAHWVPIVPIVPLKPFTITTQSERTIFAAVTISVDGEGGEFIDPVDGYMILKVTADPQIYDHVGQTITYTYTLKNSQYQTGLLTAPFIVTSNIVVPNCSGIPTLNPGDSYTCAVATYQITQADLDLGYVINDATAKAKTNGKDSNTAITFVKIKAIQTPGLALTKSASPTIASTVGTNITYTYTLTNTGNVTLTLLNVIDDKIPSVNCSGTLAPGIPMTCTATYVITNTDMGDGSVVNHADASATYEDAIYGPITVPSNHASATVHTLPLLLTVSPSPVTASAVNQVITYNYTITNNSNGSITLQGVTDNKAAVSSSCSNVTLASGSSLPCTGTYTVTTANYESGAAIVSAAYATATDGGGQTLTSLTITTSIPLTQIKALSIAIVSVTPSKPVAPATSLPEGTPITYVYSLTNTGNVTLTSPFTVYNSATTTCGTITSIAPGAPPVNCTVTYYVLAADVTAGSITKIATANGMFGATTVTSASVSTQVITYISARFSLALSASPTTVTQAGTSVAFTYTITNTGGRPLNSPYSITSTLLGTFTCSGTSPLAPGAATSCQNSYIPSSTVTNTITAASANDGGTPVPASNLPTVTVPYYVCSSTTLTLSAPVYSNSSQTATWTITNNVGIPLHITSIEFNWDAQNGNRVLNSVYLPAGTIISSGTDIDGYAIFNGSWTINASPIGLVMNFSKSGFNVTGLKLLFSEVGCGPLTYN